MVDDRSAELGCSVAVEPLAEAEALTAFPFPSRSTKLVPVTLAAEIDSLAVRDSGGLANVELSYGQAPLEDIVLFDTVHDLSTGSYVVRDVAASSSVLVGP